MDFAKYFFDLGFSLSVENPYKINKYGESDMRRTKTDKQDAKLIMHYGEAKSLNGHLNQWQPQPDSHRLINTYYRLIQSLQTSLTAEKNRIQEAEPEAIPYHEQTIKHIQVQIKQAEKAMQIIINQHPDLHKTNQLLQTIPGIGIKTAPVLLAYLTGSIRFKSVNEFVAFCGLSPTQYQSGTSINKHRKPKYGSRHLKTALYMPAMKVYSMHVFAFFVNRLRKNGKRPMTIIAAIMRKLAVIAYYIVKTQKPFELHRYVNEA